MKENTLLPIIYILSTKVYCQIPFLILFIATLQNFCASFIFRHAISFSDGFLSCLPWARSLRSIPCIRGLLPAFRFQEFFRFWDIALSFQSMPHIPLRGQRQCARRLRASCFCVAIQGDLFCPQCVPCCR